MNFFRPSRELAEKLAKYHGPYSPYRLDLNSKYLPHTGAAVSTAEVENTVQERLIRYIGTIARHLALRNQTEMCLSHEDSFSDDFLQGLKQRLHLREDELGHQIVTEFVKELKIWLKNMGGGYQEPSDCVPRIEIVLRDNSVYLIINPVEWTEAMKPVVPPLPK